MQKVSWCRLYGGCTELSFLAQGHPSIQGRPCKNPSRSRSAKIGLSLLQPFFFYCRLQTSDNHLQLTEMQRVFHSENKNKSVSGNLHLFQTIIALSNFLSGERGNPHLAHSYDNLILLFALPLHFPFYSCYSCKESRAPCLPSVESKVIHSVKSVQ